MLEVQFAAAHSGWSEIPFCLTQDGFHSEISDDQFRIKMEKPDGRRENQRRRQCVAWSHLQRDASICSHKEIYWLSFPDTTIFVHKV